MMVGMVRLDGDGRRRAVGVDFSARGRDQRALQEPGQVEHRGVEGGERRRGRGCCIGIEMVKSHGLVQNCSAASLPLSLPPTASAL